MGLLLQTSLCKSPPLITVFIDIHSHTCAEGCSIGFSTQNVSVNWFSNWSNHSHLRANELLVFDILDFPVIYVALRDWKNSVFDKLKFIMFCITCWHENALFYAYILLKGHCHEPLLEEQLSHLQPSVKKHILTLNMRGQSNLCLTRSISWLMMPWLLTSPGHQQQWYWLWRICRSWSYLRKDYKYLCHINME